MGDFFLTHSIPEHLYDHRKAGFLHTGAVPVRPGFFPLLPYMLFLVIFEYTHFLRLRSVLFQKVLQHAFCDTLPDRPLHCICELEFTYILPNLVRIDRVFPERPAGFFQFLVVLPLNVHHHCREFQPCMGIFLLIHVRQAQYGPIWQFFLPIVEDKELRRRDPDHFCSVQVCIPRHP